MKKFFSIIALFAITMSLSSFTINSDVDIVDRNCTQEAMDTYDGATALGYSSLEASQFADQTYDNCVAEGGEAESITFL